MSRFEMAFPETVEDVSELLVEHPDSRVIAGGTALTVVMNEGLRLPELLVNLRPLEDDLRYIRDAGSAIEVGALTTLREMERDEGIAAAFPVVTSCLAEVAGVRVRNAATIGGHLAHADERLDLPPVLAGLDAEVVLARGADRRRLEVEDFLLGPYETALDPGELVTGLVIPKPPPGRRGVYLKHRYYSAVDWPCVGVAAFATAGVSDVAVLLNAVGDSPVLRVEGVDDVVDGELSEEAIAAVAGLAMEQADPVDDLRGSAAYKERMVGVFTRRALRRLRDGGPS